MLLTQSILAGFGVEIADYRLLACRALALP
jgi:hypothetical protein